MIDPKVAQTNFRIACAAYEEAKEIVKELSEYVKAVSPKFSYEIAMRQFDLVLQGILLRTAVEDGYFLDEERQFVEKITDYSDIMTYFNDRGVRISWETFDSLTNEDQKDISLRMAVLLKEMADNFVTPFALVDSVLSKDFCELLISKMGVICVALARCDGDAVDSQAFTSEGATAVALLEKIVKEKWIEVVNECKNSN